MVAPLRRQWRTAALPERRSLVVNSSPDVVGADVPAPSAHHRSCTPQSGGCLPRPANLRPIGIRFVREPYPFPSFAGRESLTVQFLGPGGETVLYCYVHDLYDGQQMRPEKLDAWRALR
jgi:hypothetical protein